MLVHDIIIAPASDSSTHVLQELRRRDRADAKFCPSCGFDQGTSGTYTPPGPGSQSGTQWTFADSSSNELDKQSAIVGFILALVLSLLVGLLWAILIGIVLIALYLFVKRDIGPVKGAVVGGIIGLVIGYVINLLIVSALISSMY